MIEFNKKKFFSIVFLTFRLLVFVRREGSKKENPNCVAMKEEKQREENFFEGWNLMGFLSIFTLNKFSFH